MKRTLVLSLLLAALAGAGPAAALSRAPALAVALEIVDRDDGQDLAQYRHRGQAWVAGEPGHRYAVRLRNQGPQRVLVVLSVDGVNAISGQTADTGQAGYVLGPWQVLEVDGWRKSMDAVAQFVFVDPARSYAARTGRPDNVGVIGIAVFGEKRLRTPAAGIARVAGESPAAAKMQRAQPSPAAESASQAGILADTATGVRAYAPATPGLGTGHGRIESAPAHATTFDRQARPAQVTQLRYDTWSGLLVRGVPVAPRPRHRHGWSDAPQAFPHHFVPDPPCCDQGW